MKQHSYILILVLSGLVSCEKQPSLMPMMINEFITGEVNGIPFKSGITVPHGAFMKQDWCNKNVVAMILVKKNAEKEYQIILVDFFHAEAGNYVPTDSSVSHRKNGICVLDSVYIGLYFKSYPGDDVTMDDYRLLKGSWNYFKILYYDPEKNEIQGEFAAKFVRINKHQRAKEAVDTITYTNTKFIVSNIYVQEIFTEPR